MFRKKRVFFPPKKVTGKKQSNFIKRKKRIKSVLRRYLNYLHKKFSKVRISNKKFLLYKIKLLKYYYFLFNFLNRRFSVKIKNASRSPFLNFFYKFSYFKYRNFIFSNFIFYKDKKTSKFKATYSLRKKISYRRFNFLNRRFKLNLPFIYRNRSISRKVRSFKKHPVRGVQKTKFFKKFRSNFSPSKLPYTIRKTSSKQFLFLSRRNSFHNFKSNRKLYKKFSKRNLRRIFYRTYFPKFRRKFFYSSRNNKFWKRFFIFRLTRYYLSSRFNKIFSFFPDFSFITFFSRRKKFYSHPLFCKNFIKKFSLNKNFRRKFKKKLFSLYFSRSFRFRNKFFSPYSLPSVFKRLHLINPYFFKVYSKSWFFHSHDFKISRYLSFYKFSKLNYFKKFIYKNKIKFRLVYSRLLSISNFFRTYKRFKFDLLSRKAFELQNFGVFKRFNFFSKNFFHPFTSFFRTSGFSKFFVSRSLSKKIFPGLSGSSSFYLPFSKSKYRPRFKRFKYFSFRGRFRSKFSFSSIFKFNKFSLKHSGKRKKYKRKFNRSINTLKLRKAKFISKRAANTRFRNFYRRLSLFFRRRSSFPYAFRIRSSFKFNSFILKRFFTNQFFSRNLFYYTTGKFSRHYYFFRRKHKLYCSAFSACFRRLYRIKNRFKKRRKKFLKKIRFNFFLADFYTKKNYETFDKEKNFVSLFHSKNNFFIYVHNANGKIIHQSTNGLVGYKGPKKPTAFAAEMNARRVAKALKYSKLFPLVLVIRTRLSSFVRSAIRGLNYMGIKFSYVKRMILKGHNGLRKPGLRRT